MNPQAFAAPLRSRWNSLLPREKTLVQVSAAVVGAALLWWLAVAPALQTLRSAEAQHQALDTQLQQMQRLQAQATQLQNQPKINPDEAQRALEAAMKQRLGSSAQLNVAGDRATVTFKGTPADAIAPWLAQVRTNARTLPVEAKLVRSTTSVTPVTPATPGASAPAAARWDGTLVLTLPAR